jgi:hypothetical protein
MDDCGEDNATLAEKWRQRRERDLETAGIAETDTYLYRRGELLCDVETEARLREEMRRFKGRADDDTNRDLIRLKLDLRRWRFDGSVEIPELVSRLRRTGDKDWQPRLGVNTVYAGEPRYRGGPGAEPRPTKPGEATPSEKQTNGRIPQIGVLDTGYAAEVRALHPDLFASLRPDRDDVDVLDLDSDGLLDTQAGHGTFVAGLVRRIAPDLSIDPERVLDPVGWGDDLTVSLGLLQQRSPVVNLSLGGYSEDDRPPIALERALQRLGRDVVVVAAAGNNGSDRPFWPAAFKNVIAVAALDTTGGTPAAASFSNYGRWVDVCAPGVDLASTYVKGTWQLDRSTAEETFEGWACWSGTSFAAPLVAAEIARRAMDSGRSARKVAWELLAELDLIPGLEDYGLAFDPGVDVLCREH